MIFNQIITAYVNPENEQLPYGENYYPPDSEVVGRVQDMYKWLGITYFILGMAGALLLDNPVGYEIVVEADDEVDSNGKNLASRTLSSVLEAPLLEEDRDGDCDIETRKAYDKHVSSSSNGCRQKLPHIVFNPSFYVLVMSFFGTSITGLYLSASYKPFGEEHLVGDQFFAIVGSVGSLANALGRVVWGRLSDHFGPLYILLFVAIAGPVTMTFYTLSTTAGSKLGYTIGTILLYACYGANFSVYPSLTASLFGPKRVGFNYGKMFIYNTRFSREVLEQVCVCF